MDIYLVENDFIFGQKCLCLVEEMFLCSKMAILLIENGYIFNLKCIYFKSEMVIFLVENG